MPVTDAAPDTLADLPRLLRDAEGFADVARALRAGRAGTIDGAWGSSAALSAAALAAEAPGTVLVVLAHPGDVDPWANDLHSFTGRRPAVFPAFESWPPEPSAFDETPGRRLRTLQKLAHRSLRSRLAGAADDHGRADAAGPGPRRAGRPQPAAPRRARRSTWRNWPSGSSPTGTSGVEAVEVPGEFSRRGGILDVFSPDAADPVRLEFFGDEVESIRPFSAGDAAEPGRAEASVRPSVGERRRRPPRPAGRGHLTDYLPADAWVVLVEPNDLHEEGKHFLERGQLGRRGCSPSRGRSSSSSPARTSTVVRPAAARRRGDLPPAGRVGRAVQRQRQPRPRRAGRRRRAATAC